MKDDHSYGWYKGETRSKSIARVFVWRQHLRLLKTAAFKRTPHVFLASRIAGDVAVLRDMGVASDHIWAVEKDREQYRQLLERRKVEKFRLFPQKVEAVMETHAEADTIRSVYLDYCGNLNGTAPTTGRVVAVLPSSSVLSVTLFLGRERVRPKDREEALLDQISESTAHRVALAQSVFYYSSPDDSPFGSPMGIWTFTIGRSARPPKMRFDLHEYTRDEIARACAKPGAIIDLWQKQLKLAEGRRRSC